MVTVLDLLMRRRDDQSSQTNETIRPIVLDLTKAKEKRKPGRPRKLDRHPGGQRAIPQRSTNCFQARLACLSLEDTNKHKRYRKWTKEDIELVLGTYSKFLSKGLGKGASSKTLNRFKAKGGRFRHPKHQHITYWVKNYRSTEKKKAGRRQVLRQTTMAKIHETIMEQLKRGTHLVNSFNLRPIILRTIHECGEGDKIGDGKGKIGVNKDWINRECRKLGLSMRMPTKATAKLPSDWEQQMKRFQLQLAFLVKKYKLATVNVLGEAKQNRAILKQLLTVAKSEVLKTLRCYSFFHTLRLKL